MAITFIPKQRSCSCILPASGCLILLLLLLITIAPAQTLRSTHWSEDYIRYLQARGTLWNFSPFLRPHTVGAVAEGLTGVEPHARFLASALISRRLEPGEASIGLVSENTLANSGVGLPFRSTAVKDFAGAAPPWLYHGRQRLEMAIRPRRCLTVYNSVLLDNRLDENPRYLGIRQGGLAAYTERAALHLQHHGFSATFGRDYLRIGPGLDASLLISEHSRPLDQIALGYENRWLRYDVIAATLDATAWVQEGAPPRQNRYLALHHLQVRPLERLYIGISEAMLYSSSAPEFNYLNPILAYYGEVTNGPIGGNCLGSLHVAALPVRNLTLYADLLIDDIQLEKSGPGDLEPAEYGLMAGFRWADPFHFAGCDLFSEYTRITNRTYNGQGGPWEKWLHRNEPVAHFLGNDFDRWLGGFSWWPRPAWRAVLLVDLRRRGEGRIERAFDTPWMEIPLGQEYSEPFPTGLVEKSSCCSLELSWQPCAMVLTYSRIGYGAVTDAENQRGVHRHEWQGALGVELDLYHTIKIE
ncbi:MAG TPA: capsule assembly Wzi family protein [bacterium]|nr:capsule assembly Wzi family protein [bacterium]HQJ65932.1 capsule assembly Wzi family protein [bacterium]